MQKKKTRKRSSRRRLRTSKKAWVKIRNRCRCFYCRSNRQYRNLKRIMSAREKIKEWGGRVV